jgi:hypothetical protein
MAPAKRSGSQPSSVPSEAPKEGESTKTGGLAGLLLRNARLPVPPGRRLAFYAGVGALMVLELIEWPVALVVIAAEAVAERGARSSQRR